MPTKDKKANARISLAAGTPYKKVVKGGFKEGLQSGASSLKKIFSKKKKK